MLSLLTQADAEQLRFHRIHIIATSVDSCPPAGLLRVGRGGHLWAFPEHKSNSLPYQTLIMDVGTSILGSICQHWYRVDKDQLCIHTNKVLCLFGSLESVCVCEPCFSLTLEQRDLSLFFSRTGNSGPHQSFLETGRSICPFLSSIFPSVRHVPLGFYGRTLAKPYQAVWI